MKVSRDSLQGVIFSFIIFKGEIKKKSTDFQKKIIAFFYIVNAAASYNGYPLARPGDAANVEQEIKGHLQNFIV
jgi:hypothetical protein